MSNSQSSNQGSTGLPLSTLLFDLDAPLSTGDPLLVGPFQGQSFTDGSPVHVPSESLARIAAWEAGDVVLSLELTHQSLEPGIEVVVPFNALNVLDF